MKKIASLLLLTFLFSCENRDINEGEEFRPREVHDSFNNVNFSKVKVDGIEYLMLERDNNNPHEGFGFMAFRANVLMSKQDTLLAHLKAQADMQAQMYARIFGISTTESDSIYGRLFQIYLTEEMKELESLGKEDLTQTSDESEN
ncbi:MAG: hypothetical protein RIM99_15240 [Cyclobacteriaceae bacterium]